MLGQTNHAIQRGGLQRKLRKASTPAEQRLWLHLRARRLADHKFRRQHPFGDYILDLVCMERRLVVELDGSQHLESTPDKRRDAYLSACGFRILRFWNHEVLNETPRVLEAILQALSEPVAEPHHPLPGPPLEGEGEVQCLAEESCDV